MDVLRDLTIFLESFLRSYRTYKFYNNLILSIENSLKPFLYENLVAIRWMKH